MARNETTSLIIDEIIRYGVGAAAISTAFVLPNILIALEKPLSKLFDGLDVRDAKLRQERELKRMIRYMKSQGYLVGDYEHGLTLSTKAKRRLARREIETLQAKPLEVWDKTWRIIIYDIPNTKTSARFELKRRLRNYGCFHLQRSVLVTPFPCFEDIATLATQCQVEAYVTYFESTKLANDKPLIKRFAARYPHTNFYK